LSFLPSLRVLLIGYNLTMRGKWHTHPFIDLLIQFWFYSMVVRIS